MSDFKPKSYFLILQGKERISNTFHYYYYLSVYKITIIYRTCLTLFLTYTTSISGSQVPFHMLKQKWQNDVMNVHVMKIMGKVVKNSKLHPAVQHPKQMPYL